MNEQEYKKVLDDKVVERRGGWYYNIGGDKIGRKADVLSLSIEDLVNVESSDDTEASTPVLNPNDGKLSAPSNSKLTAPNKATEYSALLDSVRTVKEGGTSSSILDIRINGVDSRLKKDKVIIECPFEFMWRLKTDMVQDGSGGFYNGDWTVVSKKAANTWLEVSRDDSPDLNHYSVAELVLCYMKKSDYTRLRKTREVGNILRPMQLKNQRNEFAKQQSKRDPNEMVKAYGNEISKDRAVMTESMVDNKGKTFAEAKESLDKLDDLDAQVEAAKQMANTDGF